MKNKILAVLFLVWVILWAIFVLRELFVKSNIKDYAALASRDLEGKRSYIIGDKLYEFLVFCKKNLPEDATYRFVGVEDGSIEQRRAAYYLYPMLESAAPQYLIVFNKQYIAGKDGESFVALDGMRYVVKMKKGK